MMLCPIQNGVALKDGAWIQERPVITQGFGSRPGVYKQFGMNGHNGLDLRAKTGTPLYAPFEGIVEIGNQDTAGYGKFVKITKPGLSLLLGHLSEFKVRNGQKVYMGDLIALSGNTGFSTAPHLHLTPKRLDEHGKVVDANNGFGGAFDPTNLMITWKGLLLKDNL